MKVAQYSTHIPVLLKALSVTDGDVLEMGIGYFSTPLIHWLCIPKGRGVTSVESDWRYIDIARQFTGPLHQIALINNWNEYQFDGRWDVAFIDHEPAARRRVDIPRLANCARLIVVHDTSPEQDHVFHFSEIWPLFRYVRHYHDLFPGTTIASNVMELGGMDV